MASRAGTYINSPKVEFTSSAQGRNSFYGMSYSAHPFFESATQTRNTNPFYVVYPTLDFGSLPRVRTTILSASYDPSPTIGYGGLSVTRRMASSLDATSSTSPFYGVPPYQGRSAPGILERRKHVPLATTTYYRLRGYRYQHNPQPDFEEWTATSLDEPNPSGEPLLNIGVVTSWTVTRGAQ